MFFSPQNDYYCKHLTRFRSILEYFCNGFTTILQQFTLLYYYIMLTYLHSLPDGAGKFYNQRKNFPVIVNASEN